MFLIFVERLWFDPTPFDGTMAVTSVSFLVLFMYLLQSFIIGLQPGVILHLFNELKKIYYLQKLF